MKDLIACCGLNCEECEARIATANNDDALREVVAKKWREEYNSTEITLEMVNCTGCRIEGPKIGYCYECQIRKCAQSKNFTTCAECGEIETCATVGFIINAVPQAKANLLSLK